VTPEPVMACPTARVPRGVPVTVSVVPSMVPLNAMEPVPEGQKEPAGHADPDTAPCAHT